MNADNDKSALWRYQQLLGDNIDASEDIITLSKAILLKNESMVRRLIEAGADVNARNSKNSTPLTVAVYAEDGQMIKTLIEAGADIGVCCEDSMMRAFLMITGKRIIGLLLDNGVSVQTRAESGGNTLLHIAARDNRRDSYADVLRCLLERGSDVNLPNNADATPFHLLVNNCNVDMARLFLEYGADIAKADLFLCTVLHYAAVNRDSDVMELILENGADVHPQCDFGHTALLHASEHLACENVRLLLKFGADVNARSSYNYYRALNFVIYMRCALSASETVYIELAYRTIRQLLKFGIDLKFKYRLEFDMPQMTILQVAVRDCLDAANIIVQHAAVKEEPGEPSVLDESDIKLIETNLRLKKYLANCRSEVKLMKETTIDETSVTFFNVLTEDDDKIVCYARNGELVQAFKAAMNLEMLPIYRAQLEENFGAGLQRHQLLESAAVVLSNTLRYAGPDHASFEIIFKYLNWSVLKLLVRSV